MYAKTHITIKEIENIENNKKTININADSETECFFLFSERIKDFETV